MMREIELTRGYKTIVDDDIFESMGAMGWCTQQCGNYFYAARRINGKTVLLHRLILGAGDGQEVDHVNRDTLDNRKENLRLCTHSQNQMNAKRAKTRKTSQYKGVSWNGEKKKWVSRIKGNGRIHHIGYFKDEKRAAASYDNNAKKYFGEFAYLNFPHGAK